MSEKNKIKVERKLVSAIALVIIIGIATIMPLAFLMAGNNTARAQSSTDSLFNLDILCAYYDATVDYNVEINSLIDGSHRVFYTWYRDAAVIAIQPSINYAVLGNDTIARIEFFEYAIYTDKLPLQKSYSYLAFNDSAFKQYDEYKNGRRISFITEFYEKNLQTKRVKGGDYFGGEGITDPSEPMYIWVAGNSDSYSDARSKSLDKTYSNILSAIKNTYTIYLDVRRVAYISLNVDGTMIIMEDSTLLQHLELINTGDGFLYGNPADVYDPVIVDRKFYFGLQPIPYNGTSVPEEFWPIIWPDKFGE